MKSDYRKTDATRRNDLRTVEPHYSAAEVFEALGCPYPGTDSTDHRQDSPEDFAELIENSGENEGSFIKSGDFTRAYLNNHEYRKRRGESA